MSATLIREYAVSGQSTDTFGRVLCSARNHHFVVDGPVQNGCPGEALTPPEAFLASIAACGVELAQVIAKEDAIPVGDIRASIFARVDRGNPVRSDVTVFNEVQVSFSIGGVTPAQGMAIVEKFKRR
jgi:uncharacterized OsmC-like protein